MHDPLLMISIREPYAGRILSGAKTVELRRRIPRVQFPVPTVIYVPGKVKAAVGVVNLVSATVHEPPAQLWDRFGEEALGITRAAFDAYYAGRGHAVGLCLANPRRFNAPVALRVLRIAAGRFHPPQQWLRLDKKPRLANLLALYIAEAAPTAHQAVRPVTEQPRLAKTKSEVRD